MRRAAATVLLCLAAVACGGQDVPLASPSPTSGTPTPGVSPEPSPSPGPTTAPSPTDDPWIPPALQLPADAPTTFAEPKTPQQLADADYADLAPPGAVVTFTAVLELPEAPFEQVALAWRRGEDPFATAQGFVVWRRFDGWPAWRALHAFTDRPAKGVLGIRLDTGDLTADGVADLLTFEIAGGSGACGTWRVTGSFPEAPTEILRRETCDAELRIVQGGLQLREAVFEPGDAHCCPSAFRLTRLEWDGEAFVEISSEVRENPA